MFKFLSALFVVAFFGFFSFGLNLEVGIGGASFLSVETSPINPVAMIGLDLIEVPGNAESFHSVSIAGDAGCVFVDLTPSFFGILDAKYTFGSGKTRLAAGAGVGMYLPSEGDSGFLWSFNLSFKYEMAKDVRLFARGDWMILESSSLIAVTGGVEF